MDKNTITSTTQQFLDILDITGDVVILKDGSASMILSVDAINFGLLAENEQDAIIYSYAGLLNSLNYSIQILIRSQTKDVSGYLMKLDEQADQAMDKTRKEQILRYRSFVANLIQERNVLDKKFYVVIIASSLEMGFMPPSSVLPGVKGIDVSTVEKSVILERARNNLEPKRDHLIGQFGRIGLYARQLNTQEIIQLFYLSYNPEAAEGQQITDSSNYTTPLVQARVQGAPIMSDVVATPTPTVAAAPVAPVMTPPVVAPVTMPVDPVATSAPVSVPTTPTVSVTPPTPPVAAPRPTMTQQVYTSNQPDPMATTPAAAPAMTIEPIPMAPVAASEPVALTATSPAPATPEDLQATINSTVQQLETSNESSLPPQSGTTPPANSTPVATDTNNLPPLAEI